LRPLATPAPVWHHRGPTLGMARPISSVLCPKQGPYSYELHFDGWSAKGNWANSEFMSVSMNRISDHVRCALPSVITWRERAGAVERQRLQPSLLAQA